jgi:hypothetical protein
MKLSEPVAAMLDVVTLAALRLVNGTGRPADPAERRRDPGAA